MKLSVAIITKNEALNLPGCLESVKFADEIIVLDSQSTDTTREIARRYGARVEVSTVWEGFGNEKNKAAALCSGDWILSIDADERIPEALKSEILSAIEQPEVSAYAIPRLSWFCGKFIHHSGWRPDYVVRLFKRGHAHFSSHLVHEHLICEGLIRHLDYSIVHISFKNFESVLEKMNAYSSASAQQLALAGKTAGPIKATFHGMWAFLRTYVFQLGFLDGSHGFALAISNAHGTYYRYLKLWFKNNRENFDIHNRLDNLAKKTVSERESLS